MRTKRLRDWRCGVLFLSFAITVFTACSESKSVEDPFYMHLKTALCEYGQEVATHLTELGQRTAGSARDTEAAKYFVSEMKAMGSHAALEKVPVDVWDLQEAVVTVFGGDSIICSTYNGSTPGSVGPAKVVNGGYGTYTELEGADGGSGVSGKIVIISASAYFLPDLAVSQATKLGAVAAIVTTADANYWRWRNPEALGQSCYTGFGNGAKAAIPFVYMARSDADKLKAQVSAGTVNATVTVDVKVALQSTTGVGYNAVATIKGSTHPNEIIVISSHHDAYFSGAIDNSTSVALQLALAKAIKENGYKPERTIVFLSTTAEESGVFNWMYGSWYFINQTHPDWAGKIVAAINWEFAGMTGGYWCANASKELVAWLTGLAVENPSFAPDPENGVGSYITPYSDAWSFHASAIPTISFYGAIGYGDDFAWNYYHTQFDTMSLIDWDYWFRNVQFTAAVVYNLDSCGSAAKPGLLPYSLMARADDLAQYATTEAVTAMKAAGAAAETVDAFATAVSDFQTSIRNFEATKASLSPTQVKRVNAALPRILNDLNEYATKVDFYWGTYDYSHTLTLTDLQSLNAAIAAIDAVPSDYSTAYKALVSTSWMHMYDEHFQKAVIDESLELQDPDYERLYAGSLSHPPVPLDLWYGIYYVKLGNGVAARPVIVTARDQRVIDLEERLAWETTAINTARKALDSLMAE